MAQRMLFLRMEAMSSINSREVAHGSMQVVMMYLTGVSLFESNLEMIKNGNRSMISVKTRINAILDRSGRSVVELKKLHQFVGILAVSRYQNLISI